MDLAPHDIQQLADQLVDVEIDAHRSGRGPGQFQAALERFLAAVDLRVDLVERAPNLLRVERFRAGLLPELPQPLGSAVDVGQAVRHVLQGPLRQPAGRGHLAGVLQLLVQEAQVPALGLQHADELVGGEQHGGDDQQRSE